MANAPFERLFSPLTIGPVRAKNRLLLGSHFTTFAEPNPTWGEPGYYGARLGRYLGERAAGGVGTIIAGQAHVHPTTAYQMRNNAAAWPEEAIPHFRKVTEPIHQHGCLAFVQLAHNGAKAASDWSHRPLVAPSGHSLGTEAPKILERHEIAEIVEHFARSAANAVAGGFDGIELHGAHMYLVHQFLSPRTNERDDEYGGSLENRCRFAVEVLEAIRGAVGPGVAVGIRLPGDELEPTGRGLTADDAAEIGAFLESREVVDFLDVSVGSFGTMVQPMYFPHLFGVYAAAAVKKAVKETPVFAVHRIVTPEEAERVLQRDEADGITIVRALIADPEWPNKARDGRAKSIRLCTGCNQLCYGNLYKSLPIECVTNPAVGREAELGAGTLQPAEHAKRVVVVGGGVAGLEAAWVAAARGHDVILLERSSQLGGRILLGARLPGRQEVEHFADWRADECARRGVDIRLGVDATTADVMALEPDAVIVATGGMPTTRSWAANHELPLPGSDDASVVDHETAIADPEALGANVVVLDLVGHIEGVGLAELLASSGRAVTLVSPLGGLPLLDSVTAGTALRRAVRAGAVWLPNGTITAVRPGEADVVDGLSGETRTIPADTVVVRAFGLPADDLYFALLGKVADVVRVGDAVAVRTADRAIFDGHLAGRAV